MAAPVTRVNQSASKGKLGMDFDHGPNLFAASYAVRGPFPEQVAAGCIRGLRCIAAEGAWKFAIAMRVSTFFERCNILKNPAFRAKIGSMKVF